MQQTVMNKIAKHLCSLCSHLAVCSQNNLDMLHLTTKTTSLTILVVAIVDRYTLCRYKLRQRQKKLPKAAPTMLEGSAPTCKSGILFII